MSRPRQQRDPDDVFRAVQVCLLTISATLAVYALIAEGVPWR